MLAAAGILRRIFLRYIYGPFSLIKYPSIYINIYNDRIISTLRLILAFCDL